MSNTSDAVLQSENMIIDNCHRLLLPYCYYYVVFKSKMNDKRPIRRVDIILQNAAIINRQQGRSYKPPRAAAGKENLQNKNNVHFAQQFEGRRSTRQPKVSRRLFDAVISFVLM